MRLPRLLFKVFLCISLVVAAGNIFGAVSLAADEYNRQTEIVITYTQTEWWLLRWADNTLVCQVYTDHSSLPTLNEIQTSCTPGAYNEWLRSAPCEQAGTGDSSSCHGLYLLEIARQPQERNILIDLPEARININLADCDLQTPGNFCARLPSLRLTASEPLPNEYITAINGTIDGLPFSCQAEVCDLLLRPSDEQGYTVEFWADSSFGDSTERYSALVRVLDTGLSPNAPGQGWYVDVISSQWLGEEPFTSCAESWQAFPPVGGPPEWLSNPADPGELSSTEPYTYLAGRLIASGLVDAAECPAGGLLENGWANPCGLERAREMVDSWQNQFDTQIVEAAREQRIPAQLLKNLFAQETQFWPGALRDAEVQEFGFGRLTEQGADTLLLWNSDFYTQFCPLVLDVTACSTGYALLQPENQAMLRGALAGTVDADCADCTAGIDLSYSGFRIDVFARTMQANCEQTGQIVTNVTGMRPGAIASYADLWRMTLANYHAGPGCLTNALLNSYQLTGQADWDSVASYLEEGCLSAVDFVERVAYEPPPAVITPVPTETALPSPTLTQPIAPQPTSQPTAQPTVIPTQPSGYPQPTTIPYPLPTAGPTATQVPYPTP